MTEPVSPRFSLAGWSWRTYFARTKAGLKAIVLALGAYLLWLVAPIEQPELKGLLIALVTYGGKLGLDVLDYWLSDVPLEPEA